MNERKTCAECGISITNEYYSIGDNFIQVNYFEELDGSDNIFCSDDCLCKSLSVEVRTLDD